MKTIIELIKEEVIKQKNKNLGSPLSVCDDILSFIEDLQEGIIIKQKTMGKYEESLERAKSKLPEYKEVIEYIFPELKKENEDEEIIKELIQYFDDWKCSAKTEYFRNLKVDSILAWLEKQGEHKTDRKNWSEEDDKKLRDCIHAIKNTYYVGYDELIQWLRDITNN